MSATEGTEAGDRRQDAVTLELRNCICGAFRPNDLPAFVRMAMGEELADQITWNQPHRGVVFDLLVVAQTEGKISELLQSMQKEKPDNAELQEAIRKRLDALDKQGLHKKQDTQQVVEGIKNLQGHAETTPGVRDLIAASRPKLEQLQRDIEVLFNYKSLHDCLHEIQIKLYPQIVNDVKQFATNVQAPLELDNYVYQLNIVCSNAQQAAQCLPDEVAIRDEEMEWVTKLDSAAKAMSAALERQDDRAFRMPLVSIKLMLRREPDHVNKRLTNVANHLPLDELAKIIGDAVDKLGADAEAAAQLKDSFDSLTRLSTQLKMRVKEHGGWQDVERYSWEAEDCLERSTVDAMEEFTSIWELLKSKVADLEVEAQEKDWAKVTKKHAALIDQGLKGDPAAVKKAFEWFRETVLYHFFWVDKDLKARCEDILKIREPLGTLLGKV
jgi:hypothetical protein